MSRRKYSLNESIFEQIDTEEKAYWLGFLLTDGCIIEHPKPSIHIDLKTSDSELLHKFQEFLGSNYPIYNSQNKCNGKTIWSKRLKINSKQLVKDLIEKGVIPRKSLSTVFIETGFDRDFIRGIFDGDGSISQSRDSRCFVIYGTRELVQCIQDRLFNKLSLKKNKIWNSGNIFGVRWRSISDLEIIYEYLYQNASTYLSRKESAFREVIRRRL